MIPLRRRAGAPETPEGGPPAPPDARAFWLEPEAGLRLRAALWTGSGRGLAVILPGRAEFIEKYLETIADWRARGFAVAILDWRGQGRSTRALADRRLGHVVDFAEHHRDFAALFAHEEIASFKGPRVMIGHSMGGCLGLAALTAPAAPRFEAAVFTAPMLGLALEPGMERLSRRLSARLWRLGLGGRRVFGQDRLCGAEKPFEGNPLTSDALRFAMMGEAVRADSSLAVGGPTWSWLRAAFRAMDELAARPPGSLRAPTLIASAGLDEVVSNAAIDAFERREPMARRLSLPDSRHEPWMEADSVRAALWGAVEALLEERGI